MAYLRSDLNLIEYGERLVYDEKCEKFIDNEEQTHPGILEVLDKWIAFTDNVGEQNKQQFFDAVNYEFNSSYSDLHQTSSCINLVEEKPFIRNHMISCFVSFLPNEGDEIECFNLCQLCKSIDQAYYDPKRTPSLIIFSEYSPCRAIFTYLGKMNFVGGYNMKEVRVSLYRFLSKLQDGLVKVHGEGLIQIKMLELKNIGVSNKILNYSINVGKLNTLLEKMKINKVYKPEYKNLIRLHPFMNTNPSILALIYPTGGFFVVGCKFAYEASATYQLLYYLIADFVIPLNLNSSEIKRKRISYLKDLANSKLRKRKQKQQKWESQKRHLL